MEWLDQVIYNVTKQAPMVVHSQASPMRESYVVSLAINCAGMREQVLDETVNIHVTSIAAQQPHVAAADAVSKALIEIEHQTRHVFPDYSY